MSYFDKNFYSLDINFHTLQLNQVENIIFLTILVFLCLLFDTIMFLPIILLPISLNVILFIVNLGIPEDMYKKIITKKAKKLDKVSDELKNENYYLNKLIIEYEMNEKNINQIIKELKKLTENANIIFAINKLNILRKINTHEKITEQDKENIIAASKNISSKFTTTVFEKCRILMLIKEYDEVNNILNDFKIKQSISNLGFILYKNIFLYIIADKKNSPEKETIYNNLNKFFFLHQLKKYSDEAIKQYS